MNRKQLLKLQISVLFIRYKFTFLNTLVEFQTKLSYEFKVDYNQDEIEDALGELEEMLLEEPEKVIEIPEDYEIKSKTY